MIKKKNNNHELTNPDKILYPATTITKLDIMEYFLSVQEWILPYISNRPLTIVRCPQGIQHKSFYQKHLNDALAENIYPVEIEEKHGKKHYLYIKNVLGLMSLIQLNTLEIHPWGCHINAIEKPDIITFDIDPSPEVSWKDVIHAAYFVREKLSELNLTSFVKTTGGKGLHVVLPIQRHYEWPEVEVFTKTFVDYLAALDPNRYVSTMSKAKRKHKIFIDYLRNKRGATAVAPYSTRIKESATVSTPLNWDELTSRSTNDKFTIQTVPKRLDKLKQDPWEGFFELKQKLKLPSS